MLTPTKNGVAALDELGLKVTDFTDKSGHMKSMSDIFGMLNSHMKGLSGTDRTDIFHALFGTTGQQAGGILEENYKELDKLDKQVKKSVGDDYVGKLAKKNMNSANANMRVLKSAGQAVSIEFGKTMVPYLTKAADATVKLLDQFDKLPSGQKKLITMSTMAAPILGAGLVVLGGLVKNISAIYKGYTSLNNAMYKGLPKSTDVLVENNKVKVESIGTVTAAYAEQLEVINATNEAQGIGAVSGKGVTKAEKAGQVAKTAETVGSEVAGTSVAGGAAKAGKKVSGLGLLMYGLTAADIGTSIAASFKDGVSSKKGKQDMWEAGGKTLGTTVGAVLGGPLGATIGEQIGDAFAKKINYKTAKGVLDGKGVNKKDTTPTKKNNYVSKTEHNGNHDLAADRATIMASWFLPKDGGVDKPKKGKSKKTSKQSQYQKDLDGLSKSVRKNVTDGVKLIDKANKAYYSSTSKNFKGSKKVYDQIDSFAQKSYEAQDKSYQKRVNSLVKVGAISQKEADRLIANEQYKGNLRVGTVQSITAQIETAEKNGGKDRPKLVAKLNRQLLKLTDAGGKDQQKLVKDLNKKNGKLTVSQYANVLKESKKAYNKTVSTAKKKRSAQIRDADDTYELTKKNAAKVYGKKSAEYKAIVKKAQAQRDATTQAAEDQYTDTVKWAEQQHTDVVDQAQQMAAGAAAAFSTAAQNVATSIPALFATLDKTGMYKHGKPKSDDDSIRDNYNVSSKLDKGYKAVTNKSRSKSKKPKKNQSLPGQYSFAAGGAITRNQMALVGEKGTELVYNPRTNIHRLVGSNGAEITRLLAGEYVLNASDTRKVLTGKLGKNQKLAGYAGGTTSLSTAQPDSFVAGSSKKKKKHDSLVDDKETKKSLDKLEKNTKQQLSKVQKDTDKKASKIRKNVVDNYDSLSTKSTKHLKKMNSDHNRIWKDTLSDGNRYTEKIKKNATKEYDDLKDNFKRNNKQINTDWNKSWKDTTSDFNKVFAKMKPYAHSGMSGAIGQINGGITSINSALGQFGSKGDVIKAVHYAHGTNGPLRSGTMAVLNDAKVGPRQEVVLTKDGGVYAPKGNDTLHYLPQGAQVLNGSEVKQAQEEGLLPHFAKGTGKALESLREKLDANDKNPAKFWRDSFNGKIKSSGSNLRQGLTTLDKSGVNKVAPAWNAEVWKQMADTMNSSGAGGNWLNSPGAGWTTGASGQNFGDARDGGTHDGVDYGAALGTPFRAIHGGTVTKIGGTSWGNGALGNIIEVHSDDGWQQIYQEFGGMNNIKVAVGDIIKTGQIIGTLGRLHGAGSGDHLHIGVSKGSLWNHGGMSTRGWYDITKMHGKTSGTKDKKATSALSKLVKSQLKNAGITKWIGKNLAPLVEAENGMLGDIAGFNGGSLTKMIRQAAEEMHAKIPGGNYMRYLLAMIKNESGGKAGITGIDDGDGTGPAMGLLQYKRGTFNAYAVKGHKNILSAYDQLLAFFNNSNYKTDIGIGYNGKWGEWRGRASGPSGHRRYENGGLVTQHQLAEIGEKNKPEMVIPLTNKARSIQLLNDSIRYLNGGSEVKSQETVSNKSMNDYATKEIIQDLKATVNLQQQMLMQIGEFMKHFDNTQFVNSDLGTYQSAQRGKQLYDTRTNITRGVGLNG